MNESTMQSMQNQGGDQANGYTIRRASALVPTPWKNGGGTTSEIAVFPPHAGFDDFVWRTSLATIATDGAFSDFPGIDRTLVLLSGAGMDVVLTPPAGTLSRHTLSEPFVPFPFSGDTALTAWLRNGPTEDFNLMVRRGQGDGELTVWQTPGSRAVPADAVLLFVANGTAHLHEDLPLERASIELSRHDSVQLTGGSAAAVSVTLSDDAVMLVIRMTAPASGQA